MGASGGMSVGDRSSIGKESLFFHGIVLIEQ